jgi:hypothetical protein
MNLEPTTESPAEPDAPLRALGRRILRIPGKPLLVLGPFLLAAALMAVHTAVTREDCSLRLKVQHGFRSARLSVWLDDGLVYSGPLIGSSKPVRSGKKKVAPSQSAEGSLSETFTVSAGAHDVRVRVAAEDGSAQENSIRREFASHSQHTLSVVAQGNDVAMNWESEKPREANAPSAEAAPAPAPGGWLQRYAGSLLISVVGSIISAFTGYAIRELPKKITSPRAEPPKARSASAGR